MPATNTLKPKGKAASKPGGRAASTAKRPSRRAPVAGSKLVAPSITPSISMEERQRLVERAAYFRAERRGFAPGFELEDWVQAEVEVLRLIGSA